MMSMLNEISKLELKLHLDSFVTGLEEILQDTAPGTLVQEVLQALSLSILQLATKYSNSFSGAVPAESPQIEIADLNEGEETCVESASVNMLGPAEDSGAEIPFFSCMDMQALQNFRSYKEEQLEKPLKVTRCPDIPIRTSSMWKVQAPRRRILQKGQINFDGPAGTNSGTDTYLIEFIHRWNKEEEKATSDSARFYPVLPYHIFLRTIIGSDLQLTTPQQASHLTKALITLGNTRSIIQLKYILHSLRRRHIYKDNYSLSRLETLQRISAHLRRHAQAQGPFGAFVRRFLATQFYRLLQRERDASGTISLSVSEPKATFAETDSDETTMTALLQATRQLDDATAAELRALFLVWRRVGRRCLALQRLYGPGILALMPHRSIQPRDENQPTAARSGDFNERILELSDEEFEVLYAHLRAKPDPWLKLASGFIRDYVAGLGSRVVLRRLWLEVTPEENIARLRERSIELLDMCSGAGLP